MSLKSRNKGRLHDEFRGASAVPDRSAQRVHNSLLHAMHGQLCRRPPWYEILPAPPRPRLTARAVATALLAAIVMAAAPLRANEAYNGVLEMVENGGDWERFDFARIALDAMAREHEEVLARRRSNAAGASEAERAKAGRWRAATVPYLSRIYAALEAVDVADTVEVVVSGEDTVQVLVGSHNIIISPLDLRDPLRLGDEIVREFCQLHDCAFAGSFGSAPGRWEFSGSRGPGYATTAGVRCLFAGAGNRARKERACRELGDALAALTVRLRRAVAAGIEVDSAAFEVSVDGPSTLSLRLNSAGDWLMIDDPSLAPLPAVLELAQPWLAARMTGSAQELVIPHADLLLKAALAR